MFALFERLLRPTDTPEHPEPPAGLIAFFWHFARQARWLFVALFVIEMLQALTDSAVPWFMGRSSPWGPPFRPIASSPSPGRY